MAPIGGGGGVKEVLKISWRSRTNISAGASPIWPLIVRCGMEMEFSCQKLRSLGRDIDLLQIMFAQIAFSFSSLFCEQVKVAPLFFIVSFLTSDFIRQISVNS